MWWWLFFFLATLAWASPSEPPMPEATGLATMTQPEADRAQAWQSRFMAFCDREENPASCMHGVAEAVRWETERVQGCTCACASASLLWCECADGATWGQRPPEGRCR